MAKFIPIDDDIWADGNYHWVQLWHTPAVLMQLDAGPVRECPPDALMLTTESADGKE